MSDAKLQETEQARGELKRALKAWQDRDRAERAKLEEWAVIGEAIQGGLAAMGLMIQKRQLEIDIAQLTQTRDSLTKIIDEAQPKASAAKQAHRELLEQHEREAAEWRDKITAVKKEHQRAVADFAEWCRAHNMPVPAAAPEAS